MVSVLDELNLNKTLRQRINQSNECSVDTSKSISSRSFVLYLPTVSLRFKHNPGFALACHVANRYQVPLIVLCVVLDDAHNKGIKPPKPIVFTARRVAFQLEALQQVSQQWQAHGAGVGIRVHHGTSCRTPHHLTLTTKALAVIMDEPFVHPHLAYTQSVERVAKQSRIPCFRVDGSTIVPPLLKLVKSFDNKNVTYYYKGLPNKAWAWQKMTKSLQKEQVYGVVKEGYFDAPELQVKLPDNFFLASDCNKDLGIPHEWNDLNIPCPGRRPWTVKELKDIEDIKQFVLMAWPGVDATVPPCSQTHGSASAGQERWSQFRQAHLGQYAKLRNNITKPNSVSRMSCYLNLGIVSIYQIVFELWQSNNKNGAAKFEEEIVKWREMSYAHCFAYPETYHSVAVLPAWARNYLLQSHATTSGSNGHGAYALESLEACTTTDETWNAMQDYLNTTGELHNNARMTWGKTIVHWQKKSPCDGEVLNHLIYLNDRFALDGLSPPSYAGLLWCLGWCDKPSSNGSISQKPASRYRQGPFGFAEAKRLLLSTKPSSSRQASIAPMFSIIKDSSCASGSSKKRKAGGGDDNDDDRKPKSAEKKTILSYFGRPKHLFTTG